MRANTMVSYRPTLLFTLKRTLRRASIACLMLSMMWGLLGCTRKGLDGNWVYHKGPLEYKIGPVNRDWRKVKFTQNDIAFYNSQYKAIVQINATCRKDYEDTTLKNLTDHLIYGFRDRKFIVQEKRKIDRRDALYTELKAKLDGVSVQAALLVIKKNECIFDFAYITRPWNFKRGINTFHRVIYGFQVFRS